MQSVASGDDGAKWVSMNVQQLDRFVLPREFRGRNPVVVQLWWLVQATLFRWSPQFLYGWRSFLLSLFGAKVGKAILVRPTVEVTYPWKVTFGDRCWIGDHVILYSLGEIVIGHDAVISQKSYICTGSHDMHSPAFDIFAKPVVIEAQAWVATDVFVAPGVTIGEGTVVGARSSVFGDLPSGMVCVGTPAVPIKKRVK
jgi:putative colanic acid biosynthesis acetyltransferase WcaF